MKEYTYTNKAYLGIKEGIVPPAPQYLWLNSKDDRLYKFGDNGWEVTNNAPYIVEEFTIEDILTQSTEYMPKLTISRAFLDAAHKGTPIMIKSSNENIGAIPIIVDRINNPNEGAAIRFNVQFENIKYEVSCSSTGVLIGNKAMDATIASYNLVDWNENDSSVTGYIANRSHYLGRETSVEIGNRVSLTANKGTHYFDNYKVFYEGKLYNIPPMKSGESVNIDGYFKLQFTGYSVSGNSSTYTFVSTQMSSRVPSPTFQIYGDHEYSRHKALDEFFLPDGAKPWKRVTATAIGSNSFIFKDITHADITSGENVIRNNTIYEVGGGSISISFSDFKSTLEFKIMVTGSHTISISSKCGWENGEIPQISSGDTVIYSFYHVFGKIYASAKIYRNLK